MSKTWVNPFDSELHALPCEGRLGSFIPQLDEDPDPLLPERAWVLREQLAGGTPFGILLAITRELALPKYLFSYRTTTNLTLRVELT